MFPYLEANVRPIRIPRADAQVSRFVTQLATALGVQAHDLLKRNPPLRPSAVEATPGFATEVVAP